MDSRLILVGAALVLCFTLGAWLVIVPAIKCNRAGGVTALGLYHAVCVQPFRAPQ